jgi:alkanesulfonate monooxygenase SsuD/methylene tetrahydromethanopterin reductase-like flavin-dependent oxidoreductase (luciferase family)
MPSVNAAPHRFWTVVNALPAPLLAAAAQQAEAQGVHGLFAPQVYGPPFIPLAAAAAVTTRIQLASGIAIAAARSPFETAMAAIDMDRVSEGRFILGLGTSVLAWSCGVYGAPAHKPVSHLRETVAAVRHIARGVLTQGSHRSKARTTAPTSRSSSRRRRRCARTFPSGSRRCARHWSASPPRSATA